MGRKKTPVVAGDWRLIEDDREKYAAYLCSREWAERREAVRKRSGGMCERCGVLPMDSCHHVTYARKYNEPLEDLQAICQSCHDFTHGKNDFDPAVSGPKRLRGYLAWCREHNRQPCPMQLLDEIGGMCRLLPDYRWPCVAIKHLWRLQQTLQETGVSETRDCFMLGDVIADKIAELLPFEFSYAVRMGVLRESIEDYDRLLTLFGFGSGNAYFLPPTEE